MTCNKYLIVVLVSIALSRSLGASLPIGDPADCVQILASSIITTSGSYKLCDNANFIDIAASNVTLDLNQFSLTPTTFLDYGILVEGDNVTVKNGFISNFSQGVSALGRTNISLNKLIITAATTGITMTNVSYALIDNCEIYGTSTSASYGIQLINCNQVTMQNSVASKLSQGGYICTGCSNCNAFNCKTSAIRATGSSGNLYGFSSDAGTNNLFNSCIAEDVETAITSTLSKAVGIYLGSNESGTAVTNCTVSRVITTSSAEVDGIRIDYRLAGNVAAKFSSTQSACSHAWCYDGKYLAVGGAYNATLGATLGVYAFVSGTPALVPIAVPDLSKTSTVYSISWSPDGAYVAIGGAPEYDSLSSTTIGIRVYAFDPSGLLNRIAIPSNPPWPGNNNNTLFAEFSPDGNYLLTGGNVPSGKNLQVYSFNAGAPSETTRLLGCSAVTFASTVTCCAGSWHPTGDFVATLEYNGTQATLRVYSFNANTASLVQFGSASTRTANSGVTFDVKWSPNGTYLLVCERVSGDASVYIYSFNAITGINTTPVATIVVDSLESTYKPQFCWSPDGRYILTPQGVVYSVTPSNSSTTFLVSQYTLSGRPGEDESRTSASWQPGGQNLVIGAIGSTPGFKLYDAELFANQCTVQNNTINNVLDLTAAQKTRAIGLEGQNTTNVMTENVADQCTWNVGTNIIPSQQFPSIINNEGLPE